MHRLATIMLLTSAAAHAEPVGGPDLGIVEPPKESHAQHPRLRPQDREPTDAELAAAAHGVAITRLVLFDLPLRASGPANQVDHAARLAELVAAGRRGDAVEYFQAEMVGLPRPLVAELRTAPFRPALEAMAHTLVYEATVLGDGLVPADRVRAVTAPLLAIAAGKAMPFMRETAQHVARLAPRGRAVVLDGATHDLVPELVAPPVVEFLSERP
jgi:pimeloyl-ACP methyl ester carboxylesterase